MSKVEVLTFDRDANPIDIAETVRALLQRLGLHVQVVEESPDLIRLRVQQNGVSDA